MDKKGLVLIVLLSVLLSGLGSFYLSKFDNDGVDFYWSVRAGRDLVQGLDPYDREAHTHSIPYPLSAAAIGVLFTPFTYRAGAALFMGLSTGLLIWGLLKDDGPSWRLLMLASPSYVFALRYVQWSPLITALVFFPVLLPLGLAKPHITFPLLALVKMSRRGWLALGSFCLLVGGISLLMYPTWLGSWLDQIGEFGGMAIARSLSSVLAWILLVAYTKNREGTMVGLYAITPSRPFYDQLPLFLIPKTLKEMGAMLALSWTGLLVATFLGRSWQSNYLWVQFGVFIPAMLLVILRVQRERAGINEQTGTVSA